jgi:hypothetical protein
MISERTLSLIKASTNRMNKPVRLVLFTSDTGCASCPDALELARAIKGHYKKIVMESYDLVMDRDKSGQYGIQRVPAIVLQGGDEEAVTFYGVMEDNLAIILMDTIQALSDSRKWFPEEVRSVLKHLAHDVTIRVFVESDCPQCRPVAGTAIGFALESKYVYTDIIVADDFPELVKKHKIKTMPTTIFGENLQREGPLADSEFLEMIFEAEGAKPTADRRCLICGKPSVDIICAQCKDRIQAEALDHKTRIEKGMQQP